MSALTHILSNIVGEAFEALELPKELGTVQVSDRPDLAQFQCNGAMAAAKLAKKNPREVAQGILETLQSRDEFSNIEIAGPGFINLNVTDAFLQNHLKTIVSDDRLGVPKSGDGKIILDYGGMNVAKAMHVGHLRPNVIGDCLRSLLRFAGYDALGDIHMGDWGLQMGQIISEFEIRYPDWPYFDMNFNGPYDDTPPFDYKELEEIYPQASQACKDDPERLEVARKATADLQDGRAGYCALWQHFMTLSIADIKDNLAPLNIDFDIWKGEADVDHLISEIAEDLKERGISELSDGATVIQVAEDDDKHDIPPLMFFKSDGAVTYGTTDIGTIYDRIQTHPDVKRMIYVVDKRQSLHFEQVFRSCRKAGYGSDVDFIHIGNGTVNGDDGKPFKTREGKAMTFRDMVNSTIEKAMLRLNEADLAQDFSDDERADIARKVAVAALKFTELSNQPHMDYIFDLDRMTAFEGKTGPYLLYQAVRIKSLLRKAEYEDGAHDFVLEDADRPLALLLTELPNAFESSLSNYAPHHLCEYAHKLAQTFSSFYGNCHIISEDSEALKQSRLDLCALTYAQLELILEKLGIEIPERM
ncbi:MAG: arginine--tRNA ligase [Pseudomonadota bacterium]